MVFSKLTLVFLAKFFHRFDKLIKQAMAVKA